MSLLVSTCRFRSVARHCWFPPAVSGSVACHCCFPPAISGLSQASHFFRRCDRRRRIRHLHIPLFFLSFFFFLICYCCCFLPQRCRLNNGNCLAHWRIGQYYCVESTVSSRSRGDWRLSAVSVTQQCQGRGRLESGTKNGDGG